MKQKKISAVDVAARAGVSRTTVSFVINNSPGKMISEETRQRVLKAAEELGYEPNEYARGLAQIRHNSIGVFICHTQSIFSDAYIPKVIEGVAQTLNKFRFQLILQPLRLEQSDYLKIAKKDNLDGVIFINVHDESIAFKKLVDSEFPFVIIGTVKNKEVIQVDIDNRKSAKEAVAYLLKLGHRKIGMIAHASVVYNASFSRVEGYKEAMRDAEATFREEWVRVADFSEESGYRAMKELLRLRDPVTAVFAGNDVIAYGAIKAIQDAGLNIPDDISVVGFDDDYLSRYLNPPLTTITLPASGLGSQAAKLLIDIISGEKILEPKRVILPTLFSIRKSCREIS
ncbi:MAG: LacI family DNA-binding transcriptional regulator [Spirochaetales bacterium]|nr:LacI family DNA-binding transcriptional regulator [Spirochaetales bacterium]